MKKERADNRKIRHITQQQCRTYQALGAFAAALDRMPDIQEIRNDRTQSAPQHLLPMVFEV